MKAFLSIFLIPLFFHLGYGQVPTSTDTLSDKPVMVFFYADWCNFCHEMQSSIFSHEQLRQEVEDQYDLILFNGEQQSSINFRDSNYRYIPTGIETGYHEFTSRFAKGNGKVIYPVITILDSGNRVTERIVGFLDRESFVQHFLDSVK